jgi:predicted phosphoribosyltransferase
MRAAVRAIRLQQPTRIVVAVPTAARTSYAECKREADEVVALMTPEEFYAVGQWYENFSQTSDEEVTRLLAAAGHGAAVPR